MSKFLSLLVVALFSFNVGLVAARPQTLPLRPTPASVNVDVKGLTTNMKRFAAGLPPLPPIRKVTGVDTAKRAVNSQCSKSGVIEVFTGNTLLGYLSADLTDNNQHYGLAAAIADAGTFFSSVFSSGTTPNINIQQSGVSGSDYLAGLIQQGEQLGDGSGDDKAAILGRSLATNPGDTPQGNKDPSFINRDTETAIWTYDRADNSLTAEWFNYPGQTPIVTPAFIYYLANGDKFYLTSTSTTPQNGVPVVFFWISVGDQCGA